MSGSLFAPPQGGMFADPVTMGLAGLAGGFAQAAMPSRMPIPTGAALGLAAQGMTQGARQAGQGQLLQQQVEAAKIANARAQALMNFFAPGGQFMGSAAAGGGGAAPGGGMSAGGMAPASGGGAPTAPGGYLMPPQQLKTLGDLAMMTGQDRAASAIYGQLANLAGGPGYAMGPNGSAFAVPGGGKDPATIGRNAAVEAFAKLPAEIQKQIAGANAGVWQAWNTPRDQGNGVVAPMPGTAPTYGGGGTSGAPGSIPAQAYAQRVQAVENASGNPGALNASGPNGTPTSNAMGNGQFIPSTWLPLFKQTYPDVARGMTDQQILALRGLPGVSQTMTVANARQNAPTLQAAGVPVNAASLGLAHRFGAQGAVALLHADPKAPIASVVSQEVMQANPDLAGQTVGAVTGRAALRYGTAPVDLGVPGPASREVAPGVTQTQLPGGGVAVTSTRPQMGDQFKADTEELHNVDGEIDKAQADQARLLHMRDILTNLPTGSGGELRTALSNFVTTYMPGQSGAWTARAAHLPDAALAQEFTKLALLGAGEQERNTLGGRGSMAAIEMYKRANPSMTLQPTANRDILNMQLIAHQADVDYAQGEQRFITQNQASYTAGKGRYVPSTEFDQQWRAQRNPQVYSAAMAAINGKPFAEWTRGLSPQEQARAIQTIWRADPNASILGPDGKPRYNGALAQQAAR